MKRNIYLKTVELEEAKVILKNEFQETYKNMTEEIPVINTLNRITAVPVIATISNPHYNASAMDGISLNAKVTYGVHERKPKKLKENLDFKYVNTGDCIDEEHNAVIMIEDVYPVGDCMVEIMKPSHPWEHIRVVGEDISIGEMLLPSLHKITPVDIGAIISGGLEMIKVLKKIKVGIIPTGSELVNPGENMVPGNIIDSNSRVFESMVIESGGIPNRMNPVKDDRELLKEAIKKSLEMNDIVVINAGSSAGSKDYTESLISELGVVFAHGISIKPGKPTILGKIDSKAVIGIPGYPVSAFISFREFVLPLLGYSMDQANNIIDIKLSKRIVSALNHQEFVRLKIGEVDDQLIGTPLSRGAGATMSLVKADAILSVPQNIEGYESGHHLTASLLRPIEKIKKSIVSIGSHDIIMDHINELMIKDQTGHSLSSAHVGSLGGIMALKKNEAHIAPIHLLDSENGEYNISFLKKYLSDEPVVLLKGIKRWQGLIVRDGNPLNINNFDDIADGKTIFANRQKGSGTRALLDYHIKINNILNQNVEGYKREYTTHTAVALAVQSGNADTGLGIKSVATMMGLTFVPLVLEDYDFVIPAKYLGTQSVESFIKVLESDAFREKLMSLGGYEYDVLVKQVINRD